MEVEEEDWDVKGEKRAAATPYPSGAGCGRRASRGRGGQCQRRMHPHGMWGGVSPRTLPEASPREETITRYYNIFSPAGQRAQEPRYNLADVLASRAPIPNIRPR